MFSKILIEFYTIEYEKPFGKVNINSQSEQEFGKFKFSVIHPKPPKQNIQQNPSHRNDQFYEGSQNGTTIIFLERRSLINCATPNNLLVCFFPVE